MLLCLLGVQTYIYTNMSTLYTHISIFMNVSTNKLTYICMNIQKLCMYFAYINAHMYVFIYV